MEMYGQQKIEKIKLNLRSSGMSCSADPKDERFNSYSNIHIQFIDLFAKFLNRFA
jgi:hypothetical protein